MDFAEQQRRPAKHLVAFGVVVVLHILLGYALVSGLARRVIEVVKAPIETKIIEEVKPPPPPPENLPPPPEVVVTPPPVQAPVITTTQEPPPPQPVVIKPAAPEAPPAPPAPRNVQPAIMNVKACAPTADDYPAAAARAEATGTSRVRFTIDTAGKVAKAEVIRSAGPTREHKMLDRVAVEKLSTCRFTAGTDENGKPVGATTEVEYVWRLQ